MKNICNTKNLSERATRNKFIIIFLVALLTRLSLLFVLPVIAPSMRLHLKYNTPIETKEKAVEVKDLTWFYIIDNRVQLIPFQEDEHVYDQLAINALAGKGFSIDEGWWTVPAGKPASYWNFLYPFFLSIIYFIFGHHQLPVFILQTILNSVAICILYLLAAKAFQQEKVGILSALIACFHPILLFMPSLMMTEALIVPLIIFTFYFYYVAYDTGELKWYAACGFLFALASLTREVVFLFFPILVIIEFFRLRKHMGNHKAVIRSGILLAIIFLTISPWTIRNYLVFHRFLPLSTKIGVNLWMYNNPSQPIGWDMESKGAKMYTFPDSMNEVDRDRFYLRLSLDYMINNPGRVISNLPWKFLRSINPSLGTAKNLYARLFAGLYIAPMMLFSVLGLIFMRHRFNRLYILYLLLIYWFIIMIGSAPGPRYRLCVEWILISFAGACCTYLYEIYRNRNVH